MRRGLLTKKLPLGREITQAENGEKRQIWRNIVSMTDALA